jgi:hypothetical protein
MLQVLVKQGASASHEEALQPIHDDAPGAEYVPDGQGVHIVAPDTEYEPAAH